jgi:opacity protein-like surface antigen
MGTDLFTPNVASARIRFNEDLAIEPALLLGMGNGRARVDAPGGDADTTDKWDGQAAILSMDFRYGFMHNQQASAIVIAGVNFGLGALNANPDGPNNNTIATDLAFALTWGLGVEWFITRHLALSGEMVSPLLQVVSQTRNDPNADVVQSQSTFDIALNFIPGARLMFHVYY